ncbi:MAG: hypothetical protein IPO20_05905 [Gammaproteobacteria bacterium]|nr:hypothetical protein [Gammaproteobacteria bacterium]
MTIRELINAAAMSPADTARYLGVSRRTLRRYLATNRAPRASLEALRRARWIAPETVNYLEYLGVLRGIEHARRCAPDIQPGCARPKERRKARITGLRPDSRRASGAKSSVVPLRMPAV